MRELDGLLEIYRSNKDDWVTIDEEGWFIIGLAYGSGYLGSQIFIEIYWDKFHGRDIKGLVRRKVQLDFEVKEEKDSFIAINMNGFRHKLTPLGVAYNPSDRIVPNVLDSRARFLPFLKGYIVSKIDVKEEESIRFYVDGEMLFSSMIESLDLLMIDHYSSIEEYLIEIEDAEIVNWIRGDSIKWKK